MWSVLWYLLGALRIRITGASPDWALERLAKARIAVRDTTHRDAFTIEAVILKRDGVRAGAAVRSAMCDMEIIEEHGFFHTFRGLFRRPLLLCGLLLAAACAVAVPKFVLFYEVEGNERVPEAVILRELKELGVGFGTYGPKIKPQEIKNQILNRIPELQWITVQQSGMCAKVIVRERPETEPVYDRKTPTNVIAAESGVITSVSCMEGNCLCTVGQAVKKGELLVSAYRDLEFTTQVTAALAEIYAETIRTETSVLPKTLCCKCPTGRTWRQISLIVGNKRWNIFGKSGFSAANCDKMTMYHPLRLPGGYFFPVGIAITKVSEYDTTEMELDAAEAERRMQTEDLRSVSAKMIAGQVLDVQGSLRAENGLWRLDSSIRCEEMIARMVSAAILRNEEP